MRDRKGWKALGYESFKDYGEKSLGYEKAYLTQLADAGEISVQLGYDQEFAIANPIPPESQLRPLKAVPEDERKAVWDEATRKAEEEHAKLTAKRVEEAVAEWKQRNQEWAEQANQQRKASKQHGEWLPWLNGETESKRLLVKARQAQKYMQLASNTHRSAYLLEAPSIRAALELFSDKEPEAETGPRPLVTGGPWAILRPQVRGIANLP